MYLGYSCLAGHVCWLRFWHLTSTTLILITWEPIFTDAHVKPLWFSDAFCSSEVSSTFCFSNFSSKLFFFKTSPCNIVGCLPLYTLQTFLLVEIFYITYPWDFLVTAITYFFLNIIFLLKYHVFCTHLTFNFHLLGIQLKWLISMDLRLGQKSTHLFLSVILLLFLLILQNSTSWEKGIILKYGFFINEHY